MAMTADDFFAQPPRRMTEEDVLDLATVDAANPLDRGRIRAMLDRTTDPADPGRDLAQALLEDVTRQDVDKRPPFNNPARVPQSSEGEKRPLTPGELAWLDRLTPDEP